MLDIFIKSQEEEDRKKTKYQKRLGWDEVDPDGDRQAVMIMVYDVDYGYAVFRFGDKGCTIIHHERDLDKAVEWAVDRVRMEISERDYNEQQKKIDQK